ERTTIIRWLRTTLHDAPPAELVFAWSADPHRSILVSPHSGSLLSRPTETPPPTPRWRRSYPTTRRPGGKGGCWTKPRLVGGSVDGAREGGMSRYDVAGSARRLLLRDLNPRESSSGHTSGGPAPGASKRRRPAGRGRR